MPASDNGSLRLGVDVGGTFTDVVLARGPEVLATAKAPSTLPDYSDAVLEGVLRAAGPAGLAAVSELVHATTVGTNAILEGRGARTGLVTTKGFRDVLEVGRLRYPRLYDLTWRRPPPLVPRDLRLEVTERIGSKGEVLIALDRRECAAAARRLKRAGVETVAVCFLNSFANPAHERDCGEILASLLPPGVGISLSVDILPEIREYDRTSTTVINAAIKPLMTGYLRRLADRLGASGYAGPILVMQSHGGVVDAASAADFPAQVIESGPAAGVVAAAKLARDLNLTRVISLDMGGTTAKAATVEDFQPRRTTEYEVGAGMSWAARLNRGGGYMLRLPTVDLAEIGAGGGSIIRVDAGGSLHVGPESAGAEPGPVCYGRGGDRATLTDANVALGYLNQEALVGGELKINAEASRRAVADQVGRPLGIGLLEAARGAHLVANASMSRAVRAVSSERGRDPRTYVLLAFGGSGPVHAAELAGAMNIAEVLVPPLPGLFSSVGLLTSDLERHYSRGIVRRLAELNGDAFESARRELENRARHGFESMGRSWDQVQRELLLDMRYAGQSFELAVRVDGAGAAALSAAAPAIEQEHERSYGHRAAGSPIEVVNIRLIARIPSTAPGVLRGGTDRPLKREPRAAYFGVDAGLITVDVISRFDLEATPRVGPFIVEEYDSTVVVPPGWAAVRDEFGIIHLHRRP